jgi:hypothetical protein
MLGSESKVLRAAFSSWISGVKRALRALGRWSWTGNALLVHACEVISGYWQWVDVILIPTPVRGTETLRNSYCFSVALE